MARVADPSVLGPSGYPLASRLAGLAGLSLLWAGGLCLALGEGRTVLELGADYLDRLSPPPASVASGVEGLWLAYDVAARPLHRPSRWAARPPREQLLGQLRVLESRRIDDARATLVQVTWQARNVGGRSRAFCEARFALSGGGDNLWEPMAPAPCERLASGQASLVHTSRFRVPLTASRGPLAFGLVAQEDRAPDLAVAIRLGAGDAPLRARVAWRSASIAAGEPIGLSILRSVGARGCSWMYQGMDGTRRMVALARACPESLAISPDGRQGAMALPGEVQVIRGGDHKALPVPGSGTWSAFYGADATLRVASQADGVAREYAWDGSAWRVAATEAQSRPQDCRVLASASPTTATLDDCASAEPEPLDMAVLGKVRGRYPTVGGWALVRGAHGDVILAQHPEAAGVRNVFFAGPVLFRRGQELTAPLALQHGSPEARIRVVTRGAYALMSVDDAGTFRGKTFRLFDMRTGELLQTFANGVHAVQFWPSTRPWDATSAPIRAEGPLTVR